MAFVVEVDRGSRRRTTKMTDRLQVARRWYRAAKRRHSTKERGRVRLRSYVTVRIVQV
jgi:hypothetical protein